MLSLGFKTQLDQVWGSIVGPYKDTPGGAPSQRPQVTQAPSCRLLRIGCQAQTANTSCPEMHQLWHKSHIAVQSDRPAFIVLVLQE